MSIHIFLYGIPFAYNANGLVYHFHTGFSIYCCRVGLLYTVTMLTLRRGTMPCSMIVIVVMCILVLFATTRNNIADFFILVLQIKQSTVTLAVLVQRGDSLMSGEVNHGAPHMCAGD